MGCITALTPIATTREVTPILPSHVPPTPCHVTLLFSSEPAFANETTLVHMTCAVTLKGVFRMTSTRVWLAVRKCPTG